MAAHDAEDDELRSVAFQNAQSILLARRRAEDELQRQSEWLRITLASIGDAVISTDAEARVTYMNGAAEVMTGCLQASSIGQSLGEVLRLVDEHTRQPIDIPVLELSTIGAPISLGEHPLLIARDGKSKPIAGSVSPIRDDRGASVGAVVVFRDVSEHHAAEEGLARLAAIVESSDDAIVSKNLSGVIRSWNAGAERLFGYRAEEAIGKSITLIIPPDRRDEEEEILARLARGERLEHFETVRVTKQGRRVDISLTISPIRDKAGRVVGASKVARDITERKRVEETLRESDRRKDEFIALLAHELRNPLAPLRNGLQVMRLAKEDPEAFNQAWDMMERQLGHMVRLVDDLLDISRIRQNKVELRRERLLLTDAINTALETARPGIDHAGHELIVSVPQEPIYLHADLMRLAQIFSNLLTNSAKYTDPGGRIWITAQRQDDDAVVSVRDTGIGIPAASLPRIFDMFSQVERTIEKSSGGLGIGLAIVKGLVEMHGGTVIAHSEGEGKGSTFTIKLPIASKKIESGQAPQRVKEAPAKRRILVVDDNRDSATSMATMLRLIGNEVITAHDGIEAVAAAERFSPQFILMDVGMPRLNGYEATRRIRQQPWGAHIKIVALTGWGQNDDKARSQQAGCDAHLVKPVHLVDLEKLLSRLTVEKR